jgi:hypothetical protein
MADDVKISVGLVLDNLAAGVTAAKGSLETLTTSLKALAGAFAIREVADFVESMASAAAHTQTLATVLGVTTATAQEFQTLSKLGGASSDAFALGMERLQISLERGQRATSQQAAALKAMGLSVKELAALSPDQQALKMADAYQRLLNQGINPANAMILLFGRNAAGLGAIFADGAKGVEEWRKKMIEVGAIVGDDTTKKLDALDKSVTLLKASLSGLGQAIAAQGAFKTMADSIAQAAGNLSVMIQTGTLTNYVLGYLAGTAEKLGAELIRLGLQALSIATLGLVGFSKEIKDAGDAVDVADGKLRKLNEDFEKLANDFRSKLKFDSTIKPLNIPVDKTRDDLKKIADAFSVFQDTLKAEVAEMAITEQQKTAIELQGIEIRKEAEIKAGKDAGVAAADAAKEIARVNLEAAKQTSAAWKGVADTLATDFNTAFDQVLTRQKTWTQAMNEMFANMVKSMIADLIKLIAEYTILNAVAGSGLVKSMEKPTLGGVAGSVFPALGTLLGGNTGQNAAMDKLTQALNANTIAHGGNTTAHVANTAATGANTGATVTGTGAVVTGTAATGAQTVATATETGATAVQTAATATQTTTGLIPMIGAVIENTAAIIPNTIATIVNTAKGIFGLSAGAWEVGKTYGFPSYAVGSWEVGKPGAFPSYAVGTSSVPGTQLAMLHAGEMVVPASIAAKVRDGVQGAPFSGGSGGAAGNNTQNVNLSINAIDARSVANMFLSNKNVMNAVLTQIARTNPGYLTRMAQSGA